MAHEELYALDNVHLDDVHIDELLQHIIDSQGSELILTTEKPPAIRFLRFGGEVKEIRAYKNLREPVLQRMIEDILSDEQISQFRNKAEISDSYTMADASARFEFSAVRGDAGTTTTFFLLP